MKDKKFVSGLLAFGYALVISVAGLGCLISGFDLSLKNEAGLILFCAEFSLVCVLFFTRKWGHAALPMLSALLIWTQFEELLSSVELLLYQITSLYNSGYGWGYIRWSSAIPASTRVDGALMLTAGLIIAAVSWTVYRKKWCGFAVIAGLLPLISCCVLLDTVPDDPWLFALAAALLMLILTHRLRRASPRQANRITALILVPVVLCTALLFNRSQGKNYSATAGALQQRLLELAERFIDLDIGGDQPIVPSPGVDKSVSHVNLSNTGPLELADYVPLYVTAPESGILYLRSQAYDRYTGTGWYATEGSEGDNGWPVSGLEMIGEVTLSTVGKLNQRFFPYYVGDTAWSDKISDGAYTNPNRKQKYTFSLSTAGENVLFTPLTAEETAAYTDLPADTAKAAEKILEEMLGSGDYTARQKAVMIAEYVQSSAVYDLNTPKMDSNAQDFAIWFLESSDSGYCVHFATATAVLLRAAGIPARYVTGYLTYTIAGVECPVNNTQSHAWVEYLDPQQGWTRLESTPGAQDVEPPEITLPPETTLPEDTTAPPETTLPEDTTAPPETTLPEDTTAPPQTSQPPQTTQPAEPSEPGPNKINLEWVRYILYVLLCWAVLAGQYRLRQKLRRRRFSKGSGNARGLTRWRYARFLSRITGLSRPAELRALADKAAFSQHELTESEIAQFDGWIHAAQQKLLDKPWPVKWLLRLIFAI